MSGNMRIALGVVGLAIAFIVFPIVMTAAATIMNNANIANYTGLSDVVGIAPLVILVGIMFGSGASVYSGVRMRRRKSKKSKY